MKNICDICGKGFEGYGNNPAPLEGRICCDACNKTYVIPARLKKLSITSKLGDASAETPQITELRKKIGYLISEEVRAIDDYDEALKTVDLSEDQRKTLEEIRNDEIDHTNKLNEIYKSLMTGEVEEDLTEDASNLEESFAGGYDPATINTELETEPNVQDGIIETVSNAVEKIGNLSTAAEDDAQDVQKTLKENEISSSVTDAKMTVDRMIQIITPIVSDYAKKKGVEDYWKIYKNGKNVSVGMELGYRDMDKLCDILNAKLAPLTDSYFEPADAGLIETTVFDSAIVKDSYYTESEKKDKQFVKNAIEEMEGYINNWNFLTARQKRDIGSSREQLKARVAELKQVKDSAIKDSTMRKIAHNKEELKNIINSWDGSSTLKVTISHDKGYYDIYFTNKNGYYSVPVGMTRIITENTLNNAKSVALRYINKFFDGSTIFCGNENDLSINDVDGKLLPQSAKELKEELGLARKIIGSHLSRGIVGYRPRNNQFNNKDVAEINEAINDAIKYLDQGFGHESYKRLELDLDRIKQTMPKDTSSEEYKVLNRVVAKGNKALSVIKAYLNSKDSAIKDETITKTVNLGRYNRYDTLVMKKANDYGLELRGEKNIAEVTGNPERIQDFINYLNNYHSAGARITDSDTVNDIGEVTVGSKYRFEEKYGNQPLTVTELGETVKLSLDNSKTYLRIPREKFEDMVRTGRLDNTDTTTIKQYGEIKAGARRIGDFKSDELVSEIRTKFNSIGKSKIEQYVEKLKAAGGYKDLTTRLVWDLLHATTKSREISDWYDKYDVNDNHITNAGKDALRKLGINL